MHTRAASNGSRLTLQQIIQQTGQPLRVLSDEVAEKTARQLDAYPSQGDRHLSEILAILDREEPDFRD